MSNLFKSFTPYLNNSGHTMRMADFDFLEEHTVDDPSPTSWSSMGFANVQNDELVIDVQGAGFLVMVQINERILPASVQKEKIAVRIADIERRDGRKPGKKEYAQVRDEVILELLPDAFIKRKTVPVLFIKQHMYIFATSAKTCDDVIMMLIRALPDNRLAASMLSNCVTNNIVGALTTLAKEGTASSNDQEWSMFQTTDVALLKGENKETIRIKDKGINTHDVQTLLKQKYEVTALGLEFIEAGSTDASAAITINDKLIVGRMVLEGVKNVSEQDEQKAADTFIATAWLTCRISYAVIEHLIEVMGGLKSDEKKKEVDDDEL